MNAFARQAWLWAAVAGLAVPAVVEAQFICTTNSDNTITIRRYTGTEITVAIPSRINALSVTCFSGQAFRGCTNLTSVTIPESVISIPVGGLRECPKLSEIVVNATNSSYSSVDGVLFNKGQTTLIQYPMGKAGKYTIPDGVTDITPWAFEKCVGLDSVAMPDSVTNIGDHAFYCCTNLFSVKISESVTNIGTGAFADCYRLTNITPLPTTVTQIGDFAFGWCYVLRHIRFKGNLPILGGSQVFYRADKATIYHLPNTTGWGTTFGGRPTAIWEPQVQAYLTSLNSLPKDDIDVIENVPTASRNRLAHGAVRALVNDIKTCLAELGVKVRWNADTRTYEVVKQESKAASDVQAK